MADVRPPPRRAPRGALARRRSGNGIPRGEDAPPDATTTTTPSDVGLVVLTYEGALRTRVLGKSPLYCAGAWACPMFFPRFSREIASQKPSLVLGHRAHGACGRGARCAVCGMRGVGGFLSWKGRWGDVFCIAGALRSADSDAQGGETRGRPQRWDRECDPSMQRSASVPDRAIGPDGAPRACVDAGEDAEALKHGQRVDRAGLAVPEHACERASERVEEARG